MAYTLNLDGVERPLNKRERANIAAFIADVASGRADFMIIREDKTKEFVQCAEAHGGVVAERKVRAGRSWQQTRIVREDGSKTRLPPRVAGYQGYEEREVLKVDEFQQIVKAFLAGEPPGDGFELVDVTRDYAAAAKAADEA